MNDLKDEFRRQIHDAWAIAAIKFGAIAVTAILCVLLAGEMSK